MMRYTRKQIEEMLYIQLDNLNALNDRIQLLKEQNELLLEYNNKLKEELHPTKKYSFPKIKKCDAKLIYNVNYELT